ncbi:MAG: hypothetical protein DI626_07025 [Micavibrio aeruginosavorus]|uniref:Uncharacterized protein n=1 Tax=Micavibrio aeruginosavorus TaxID=349221 RepID=A0A2W5BS17_9BACT|nr:MAG: hypothetical protein DI626_07025 [Micavibrio aeruginosavorus]
MSLEETDVLKNASAIIERFGGIRPMAAKVGAPVTTVQGWKKRDVIPGVRRDDILRAAQENGIDLSDLISDAPVIGSASVSAVVEGVKASDSVFLDKQDVPVMPPVSKSAVADEEKIDLDRDEPKITVEPLVRPQPRELPASFSNRIDPTHDELMAAIALGQKKAARTSLWTALTVVVLLGGAAAVALWPSAQKIEKHDAQIATLEGKVGAVDKDVQAMNESAGFIKDMVPEEMRKRMAELREEAETIRADVQTVAQQAQDISKTVLAADAGSLSDRMSVLEAKFGDMEGGQALKDLTARIRNLEVTMSGQDQLNASVAELSKIVDSLDGQVNTIDQKLAEVQAQPENPLAQTLEGVSGNDLKAAALLIAFSQLRDSLNRNVPFEDDVVLLQKLVGEDDPQLQAALTRLTPQAEKGGVLTSEGLSKEFKTMAGDIVFSSLKGEDVSVSDKAKARLTQVLNVKKDGELVGGTPTQKTVARAQEQLDAGDVQGAISTLQSLNGDARVQAQPFIEQAEATVLAEQVQNMLRQMIVANVGTDFSTASGAAGNAVNNAGQTVQDVTSQIKNALPTGQNVVKDEKSGFAIMPAPKGFKGFSSGQTE